MLFNSIEFAIFLPIVFILYWFVFNRSLKLQNLFVVIVSYIFYGWWDWRFLLLIAFTSFCSWLSGLLIERYRNHGKLPKTVSAINIIINILILGLFKYYDFFAQSFADMFLDGRSDGILLHVVLPVGISFYTFQALSYSIDVYRGKIEPTHDVIAFFAFVGFFPQLVAGPIERATNLLPQFQQERSFDYDKAVDGLRQMLWGFFKKIVIADNCAVYVDKVFSTYQTQSGSTLFIAAVFFTFQIYADFSGYSDIAIGTAKLFGIRLVRNFKVPYFSRDIAEFWRRWHISLTTWFRDYVYIPLGGSRVSKAKIVRNIFIIFLVSGFWHGANWTYLAWGAYHAVLFLPLILLGKNRKFTNQVAEGRILPTWKETGQMLLTFFLAVLGWIIFRADSIGTGFDYVCGMWQLDTLSACYRFFTRETIRITSILIVMMLVVEWLQRRKEHGMEISGFKPWVRMVIVILLIESILFFKATEPSQFIYFQF